MSDLNHREIEALNQNIRDLNTTIRDLQRDFAATYVRKDVIEPQLQEMRQDIESHDNWLVWAQRLVLGAIIIALIGLVVTNGGSPL